MNKPKKKTPFELRMRVLSAIDYAPGNSIQARIKHVSERTFTDEPTGLVYKFTHRTISTWLYRFKKMASLHLTIKRAVLRYSTWIIIWNMASPPR
jgi:hypothetical protein